MARTGAYRNATLAADSPDYGREPLTARELSVLKLDVAMAPVQEKATKQQKRLYSVPWIFVGWVETG